MANYTNTQMAQLYQIQTARDLETPVPQTTESIDLIFSKAYDSGLLNDIGLRSIKPGNQVSRNACQYEPRVRILTKGALFRRA